VHLKSVSLFDSLEYMSVYIKLHVIASKNVTHTKLRNSMGDNLFNHYSIRMRYSS
jgi:glycine/serine hydroxymethyltransferase